MQGTAAIVRVVIVGGTILIGLGVRSSADGIARHPASPPAIGDDPVSPVVPDLVYFAQPAVINVAELSQEFAQSDISDVVASDFDGDGRVDIAVAWFATDLQDRFNSMRILTIFRGTGTTTFTRLADYDLYEPHAYFDALSIFRNGTADIGVGDFDGDGDIDLAIGPNFGDEIWFFENLGDGTFEQYVKFPFGFNTTGNFQTPPEMETADFDGDGRDDLVVLADPVQYIQSAVVHFWTTSGVIADMTRQRWEGIGTEAVQWTRGLAVADYDGDHRPDVCFTGSTHPPEEDDPVVVIWHNLDLSSRQFEVREFYPHFLCSDVAALEIQANLPPGLILTDLDGHCAEYWSAQNFQHPDYRCTASISGYLNPADDRGVAAELADVDGDGDLDLITRQKLGAWEDEHQVEIALSRSLYHVWTRVADNPINTRGFQDLPYTEILRPRNLAAADLYGNSLPEVIAAFGPAPVDPEVPNGDQVLRIAIWQNSCMADATRDGRTTAADLSALLSVIGVPGPHPDEDFNKDGVCNLADLTILLGDYGCDCNEHSSVPRGGE